MSDNDKSPFWHYHSSFDALEVIERYAKRDISPSPGHYTNFLGTKIRPVVNPSFLSDKVGLIECPPLPNNCHADIAEWASCLRAIDISGERFVMLELGCGWGAWMNILGATAKGAGKAIKLFGVEADEAHISMPLDALRDNGIDEAEFVLVRGIAGRKAENALFPRVGSGANFDGEAIFNPSEEQIRDAAKLGTHVRIPVIDIAELIKSERALDLLHVDIQGAQLDLLTELFDLLCKKVRCVFVGTHSKQIEGGLFDLFMGHHVWKLEMERPAIFQIVDGRPIVVNDGVQTWRNHAVDLAR